MEANIEQTVSYNSRVIICLEQFFNNFLVFCHCFNSLLFFVNLFRCI